MEGTPIRCKLFASNLAPVDWAFRDGDLAVIVLADLHKLISKMDGADSYYDNPAKIDLHLEWLRNGSFEIPLVAPFPNDKLHWIEGIHQVNSAFQYGLGVVPISTAARYAETLKKWLSPAEPRALLNQFDFTKCAAAVLT